MRSGGAFPVGARLRTVHRDMKHKEIDAVISRAERAVQSGESIPAKDLKLLLEVFKAYLHVHERLQNNDLTLHRLRKLLGIIPSSEKSKQKSSKDNNKAPREKPNRDSHGKSSDENFPEAEVVRHKHTELKSGDSCPSDKDGKIYKYEPAKFVRITGEAPLKPSIHIIEQLRCNGQRNACTSQMRDTRPCGPASVGSAWINWAFVAQ